MESPENQTIIFRSEPEWVECTHEELSKFLGRVEPIEYRKVDRSRSWRDEHKSKRQRPRLRFAGAK